MLTQGEDVEVHALARRGWSVSAIARHLGRDRKTVRAYLTGKRQPGRRAAARPDPLALFVPYLMARFADDPHLWATALYDEVVPLGYGCSYVSFARQLRLAGLRPHCEACSGVAGRQTIEIAHPPGEEALCGYPHRVSYAARGNMRRSRSLERLCRCLRRPSVPHNHRPSRKASSVSGGWYRPGLVPGGAVLAMAASLSVRSACR
jgi:hypothetical protein